MEIDATDRRILAVLQKEGRVTNAELAERVNLSPSACHRRVPRRGGGAGAFRHYGPQLTGNGLPEQYRQ